MALYSSHSSFGTSPASYNRDNAITHWNEQRHMENSIRTGDMSDKRRRLSFKSDSRLATPTEEEEENLLEPESIPGAQSIPGAITPSTSGTTLRAETGIMRPAMPTDPPGEQTPLLKRVSSDPELDLPPVADQDLSQKSSLIRQELAILIKYTLPIFATHVLESSLTIATVISTGHLGTEELAAASLGSMTANVTALSIIQGFVTALDTLCPQAWTSENPQAMSLHCMRTTCIIGLLLIPMYLVLWNSHFIFLILRQDPTVALLASEYLKIISLGLPGYALFEISRRWLQAQNLMLAPTYAVAITAPVNILLNYILVWSKQFGIGFRGAPLATAISMNLMAVFTLSYCFLLAPRIGWGGFSKRVWKNWHDNWTLGLAGTAMVASEWWSWEIVGLASSALGPARLAAQSVLLTTCSFTYQFSFSMSAAASVRVGNLLGAGRPDLARVFSRVALWAGIGVGLINSFIMLVNRDHFAELFTRSPEVISIVADVLPLLALFQVFDSSTGVAGGLLRGAGRSQMGAWINLSAYYAIGLPAGMTLAFWSKTHLGLIGLWAGLTIALGITGIVTFVYVWFINFELEAQRASLRAAATLDAGSAVHIRQDSRDAKR